MKPIRFTIFLFLIVLVGCKDSQIKKSKTIAEHVEEIIEPKPIVSFTFDDGSTSDFAGFKFKEWNKMILSHLNEENLKAMFFVTGRNKTDEKGTFLLKSWNDNGHKIANHSFSHPNFNSQKNSAILFENELMRTDIIITNLSNKVKLFRFPYLKEGEDPSKVDSIRKILVNHNYLNGYVTIDASDWYINQRLIEKINLVGLEKAKLEQFKNFYVQHIMERANYYEKRSFEINNRHISHTLLLHHNLTSALFLDDLIDKFKASGWEFIDADKAYQDKIFEKIPASNFAGESLIYSLAKQSGKYNQSLRYPAEDSQYEKGKMDKLGL